MNLEDADRRLREIVAAIPEGDRAFLLETLGADEETRAQTIGNLHATRLAPATVELLIDAEHDREVRALLVGILRETERANAQFGPDRYGYHPENRNLRELS